MLRERLPVFNWKAAVCRADCAATGSLLSQQPVSGAFCQVPCPCAGDTIPVGGMTLFGQPHSAKPTGAPAQQLPAMERSPRPAQGPFFGLENSSKGARQSGSYPCALLSVGSWKSGEANRALGERTKRERVVKDTERGSPAHPCQAPAGLGRPPASAHQH